MLAASTAFPVDRVPAGRTGRRATTRPDEDAITLAAEAAGTALRGRTERPSALLLATTTPAYATGGSVQALAELLDLQGALFGLDLNATPRDGLAALRLGALLVREGGTVLVCAAHAAPSDRTTGDGAVALLLGPGTGDAIATVEHLASRAEEIRDRWALPGGAFHEADKSFVQEIATRRTAEADLNDLAPEHAGSPVVVGPDLRTARRVEAARGGAADPLTDAVGVVGAAHPLLRLLAGLDAPATVLALSNGLGDVVRVTPGPGGPAAAEAVRTAARGGEEAARPALNVPPDDFTPAISVTRAWRERDADLRLRGLIGRDDRPAPGREPVTGRVLTWTRDHAYPESPSTVLALVDVDDGGQFFGQVASGHDVEIGGRVRLVPRLLHQGGSMNQYFWKVIPCR